jgi:hypothetical protein
MNVCCSIFVADNSPVDDLNSDAELRVRPVCERAMSVDCDCLSLFLLFVIIDGQVSARDNSHVYNQVPQAIVARTCKKLLFTLL